MLSIEIRVHIPQNQSFGYIESSRIRPQKHFKLPLPHHASVAAANGATAVAKAIVTVVIASTLMAAAVAIAAVARSWS